MAQKLQPEEKVKQTKKKSYTLVESVRKYSKYVFGERKTFLLIF